MPKNYETFQLYINGEPAKKFFKVASRQSLWTQYNGWAKKQGGKMVEDDRYLGNMAWQLDKGIAEVRLISVTTGDRTHVY